jgi:glycosyltransferase involved in cell wall biosynthesis
MRGALRPAGDPSAQPTSGDGPLDIVVVSHLRWDFVFQRPQHLMTVAAREHRVLFVEEPVAGDAIGLASREDIPNITVVVPHVPPSMTANDADAAIGAALRDCVSSWRDGGPLVAWHYAVMAEPWTRELGADVVVYDCMDELSSFLGAPPELLDRERTLLERSDLVFTGGYSLYEAKRHRHAHVYPFPSSVDVAHFRRARRDQPEPAALTGIGSPRLMYAGVIDERVDLDLVAHLAAAQIGEVVLVGPVVKIDEAAIPFAPNIHRLGMQRYADLPALFAHADVGLMPFAQNDATRYISPTKTPEYLAAGLPVVSTAITDVVRGYGDLDRVHVADDRDAFVAACRTALDQRGPSPAVDARLAGMSWQATWDEMHVLLREALDRREAKEFVRA